MDVLAGMPFNSSKLRKEPDPEAVWLDCLTDPKLSQGAFPCDIDAVVEISGYFLIIEFKKPEEALSGGQLRLLESFEKLSNRMTVIIVEAVLTEDRWLPGTVRFISKHLRLDGPAGLRWFADSWDAFARQGKDIWDDEYFRQFRDDYGRPAVGVPENHQARETNRLQ